MADDNNLKLRGADVDTAYLIVLASLIETIIESGSVPSEDLAKKIDAYASHANADGENKNVTALASYFAGIARGAKPRKA